MKNNPPGRRRPHVPHIHHCRTTQRQHFRSHVKLCNTCVARHGATHNPSCQRLCCWLKYKKTADTAQLSKIHMCTLQTRQLASMPQLCSTSTSACTMTCAASHHHIWYTNQHQTLRPVPGGGDAANLFGTCCGCSFCLACNADQFTDVALDILLQQDGCAHLAQHLHCLTAVVEGVGGEVGEAVEGVLGEELQANRQLA